MAWREEGGGEGGGEKGREELMEEGSDGEVDIKMPKELYKSIKR